MITPEYLDRLTRLCDIPNVDRQVFLAAEQMDAAQKKAPEWLFYSDEKTTFGRWQKAPEQAPYIRADLVLLAREAVPALITALQAERVRSAARLEALEQANKLMNHMGDILNCHDMVTDEDEEMSTPIFELVARALAAAEGGGDA